MIPPTQEEIVRRREMIKATLAASGLAVAAPMLDAAAHLPPVDEDAGRVAEQLDRLDRAMFHHAEAYPVIPSGRIVPAVVRDYAAAGRLASRERALGGDGQWAQHIMACLAGMTGAMMVNLGHTDEAARWHSAAHDHAEAAGVREVEGWQRSWQAVSMFYAGRHQQAARIATEAAHKGGLGATMGAATAARSLAATGEARAALALLARAERAVDATPARDYSAFTFPAVRFHQYASNVLTLTGQTRRAEEHQAAALAGYSRSNHLDRHLVVLDSAHCLAIRGEIAEAADRAALIASGARSAPVTMRANEIYRAVRGYGLPETRRLGEAVAGRL